MADSVQSYAANGGGMGGADWHSPANCIGEPDGNFAYLEPDGVNDGLFDMLMEFALDAGYAIVGFGVDIWVGDDGALTDFTDLRVGIGPLGSPTWSTTKLTPAAPLTTDGDGDIDHYSYGSDSDLWGLTPTPSDVNDGLQLRLGSKTGTVSLIDAARVTIYYTGSAGGPVRQAHHYRMRRRS